MLGRIYFRIPITQIEKLKMINRSLPLDEKWNVITHGLGAVISAILVIYYYLHLNFSDPSVHLAYLIYGFSLVFLFSASALYHSVEDARKTTWQKIDHIAIYLLIAGTYTPVSISLLQETSGKLLLTLVWGLALIGIIYKLFFIGRFKRLSLFLYLAMGWLVVFDFNNVLQVFPETALHCLILGGVFYSVGTIFYSRTSWYYHHVVWHLWVLAGAFAHFQMVRIILENTT